jgi:hypothetical protein
MFRMTKILRRCTAIALTAGAAAAALAAVGAWPPSRWWAEGSGEKMPATVTYSNEYGRLTVLNAEGPVDTKGHPFFEPIGTNGRACVTCHQPADGMSISVATLRERWAATNGKDPVFAAIDGSNCPSLPQEERSSHSLLLDHGLFRIFFSWPPKGPDGKVIEPEFTIEVVKDPTGCNLDPVYGLYSKNPSISVFRRPRVAANLKYVTEVDRISKPFDVKTGDLLAADPETGRRVSMNIMADSREPTLRTQAINAASTHMELPGRLTPAQLDAIVNFESQVYVAQSFDFKAGDLTKPGGPPGLGPEALLRETPGIIANGAAQRLFGSFDAWAARPGEKLDAAAEHRASVSRGAELFQTRTIWIRDVYNFNTLGVGNPQKRNCVGCHNMSMTGLDIAPGYMDLGTANLPYSEGSEGLPLFKLTCSSKAQPHPYLGREIYTHDPGRALVTGRCRDIGAITMQQMRGLAARAPYFSNGSAATLRDVIEIYDRRFDMKLTEQEKVDLTNFLSVL